MRKSDKARVAAGGIIDFAVDLLLPTLIYVALAPTDLSAVVRLTVGGFFVAAKAGAGHLGGVADHDPTAPGPRAFLSAAALAVTCSFVTIGTVVIGASDAIAIGLGTAVLVVAAGLRLLRAKHSLDGFAVLVLMELAATIVLTSVSDDPRFVLVRPGIYTAIAGIYVLTTIGAPRPFMMQVSKPMAAGGDRVRADAFERAGRESLRFRRTEQAMTAGLGAVLLAESILRAITVYAHSADDVVASSLASQVPGVALFVIYFALVATVAVPRATREVDAFMPATTEGAAQ